MNDEDDTSQAILRGNDAKLLVEYLRRAPDDLRTQIRRTIRETAAPVLADARRRASWSSRIPRAISTRVIFRGSRAGVRLTVSSRSAPHARPYEGLVTRARDSRRTGFRHPVWGEGGYRQQWTWVNQPFRPFLLPAVEAAEGRLVSRLLESVDGVLTRRGY